VIWREFDNLVAEEEAIAETLTTAGSGTSAGLGEYVSAAGTSSPMARSPGTAVRSANRM